MKKIILGLTIALVSSTSMASVCFVKADRQRYYDIASVTITCERGNKDSKVMDFNNADGDTSVALATALDSMLKKGYKITTESNDGNYTMTK